MTVREQTPTADDRGSVWFWAAVAAVIAAAVGLRTAGIFDDLWFDEVWSWWIARSMHTTGDVLTSAAARIDNNHVLNTLLMYWVGDRAYWPVYRVPSLAAGVATVVLATWHTYRRAGRAAGFVAAVLLGLSYPLVVYSSEARGYGLMVFFAVACFVAMDRFLRARSWGAAAVFSASAALGFLSHLTFAHFYAAAVVWSSFRLTRESRSWKTAAADFLRCHAVPVVFAAWFYAVFAGRMIIGGAPASSLWEAVVGALSLMAGGPAGGTGALVAAAVAAVVLAASLAAVWRRDRALFLFFVTCVVVSPAAFVAVQVAAMRGMEMLFPRYFLVSMAFGYLLVATAAGAVVRRGAVAAAVVTGLVACFAAGSLWQTALFLGGTRGHYADAVRRMAETSPGGVVTVGSDNAFRTEMMVGFYARYAPAGASITYTPPPPKGSPEWFIVNTPQAGVVPRPYLLLGGVPYAFDREFTYHGLSGWSWYLFRRERGR